MIYSEFAKVYDAYSLCYDYGIWFDYLIKLSGLKTLTGKKILELGCGTGKMLAKFASCKAFVTGVDSSDTMLSIADEKFFRRKLPAALINFDMGEFASNQKFDFIYAMGDSVNYLNGKELESLISNVSAMLAEDAAFTFDALNKTYMLKTGDELNMKAGDSRVSLLRNIKDNVMLTQVIIENTQGKHIETHKQHFHSTASIHSLAEKHRLSFQGPWGIFEFEDAHTEEAEKLQYVLKNK